MSAFISGELDELGWHMINEPNAVGRASEDKAVPMHITRTNREQRWFSMTATDLESHFSLCGQVNVMSSHSLQSSLTDTVQKTSGCAVIKKFRRCLWWVLQIHFD